MTMNRLVLIDGVNFFYRGAWQGTDVCTVRGEDMSYVVAYIRNLCSLMEEIGKKNTRYVICWEGGYDERLRISSEAVEKGLIPKAYKQERREAHETEDAEEKKKAESFKRQRKIAEALTAYTIVGQVKMPGEEADDVIGSLAVKYYDSFDEIILVTTDRDYYQLINDKVRIYNSSKREYKGLKYLQSEYNLVNGAQWIDVGALAGESGKSSDTIYGVPGIGYVTAAKLISQYGSLDNLVDKCRMELAGDILKCKNDVKELYSRVKSHKYTLSHHVKEMYVLAHMDIVELAKKLKAIRTFLDVSIPEYSQSWFDLNRELQNLSIRLGKTRMDFLTEI